MKLCGRLLPTPFDAADALGVVNVSKGKGNPLFFEPPRCALVGEFDNGVDDHEFPGGVYGRPFLRSRVQGDSRPADVDESIGDGRGSFTEPELQSLQSHSSLPVFIGGQRVAGEERPSLVDLLAARLTGRFCRVAAVYE